MSDDLQFAFLLAIIGAGLGIAAGTILAVNAYRRFRYWLRERRRERARKALRDVFGGAIILARPLNRDHLEGCVEYEVIHSPSSRVH